LGAESFGGLSFAAFNEIKGSKNGLGVSLVFQFVKETNGARMHLRVHENILSEGREALLARANK